MLVWWNAPWSPVTVARPFTNGFDAGRSRWRRDHGIRHIVADGDVVLTERVDHFVVGDVRVSVPCMGIFGWCVGSTLTESIFVGRIGATLFVLGFTLWNMSRLLLRFAHR
jgi:hypothetical protein